MIEGCFPFVFLPGWESLRVTLVYKGAGLPNYPYNFFLLLPGWGLLRIRLRSLTVPLFWSPFCCFKSVSPIRMLWHVHHSAAFPAIWGSAHLGSSRREEMVRALCPFLEPYLWPVAPLSSPATLNSASDWYCLPGSCSIWFSELFDITFLDPTQHNSVVWLGAPAGFFMGKSLSSLTLFHVALPFFPLHWWFYYFGFLLFSIQISSLTTTTSCLSQLLPPGCFLTLKLSWSKYRWLFSISLTFACSANHGQNFGEL